MKNKLFLDSSTDKLYLGLKYNNKSIYKIYNTGFAHTENLAIGVDQICHELNCGMQDIEEVILGKGPGSFTGIRIAYAFIKGAFANSTNKNILEISNLDLCNISINRKYNNLYFTPMYFGRKQRFYSTLFSSEGKQIDKYYDCDLEKLLQIYSKSIGKSKLLIAIEKKYKDKYKEIFEKFENLFFTDFNLDCIKILNNNFDNYERKNVGEINPMYLRKPDALENKK